MICICVYSAVILPHVCSADTKVLGKNVLSGKNENFVTCILKKSSYRENVLEAVLLDKVINRPSNLPHSNFSEYIYHHCNCGINCSGYH